MCFNAALVQTAEIIQDLYGAQFPAEKFDIPTYFTSAFEHPRWPILKQDNRESFVPGVWGLIPSWTKSAEQALSIRDKTLNARYETLDVKPSFRGAVNHRRCGVLVDGFVEWRSYGDKKYPYHIALPEKRPFLLAGIWDRWVDPGSDTEVETFSVITVEAKGLPAQIHNIKMRMPLILGKESGRLWLNPGITFTDCAGDIQPLYNSLKAWPVGRSVSIPGESRNRSQIQAPYEYPELQPLEVT